MLGVRDYARKNGFERALVGLSGGIDSALVALIAADALGAEQLTCVVMPSPHSSAETQADARAIAAQPRRRADRARRSSAAMDAYDEILGEHWSAATGLAAENVQARIRGNLLMALSNDRGSLVLDDRQQERDVGRLRDPLRRHGRRARGDQGRARSSSSTSWSSTATPAPARELVPASVIERAPSAELRPDQLDEDSLPPYELLDRVLEGYVERDLSRES